MSKDDLQKFQKLVTDSLGKFWDDVLEPAFNRVEKKFDSVDKRFDKVEERLDGIDERLGNVDNRLDNVEQTLDSVDRRLNSETSYRDRLEKRVVKVENKLDLPH